MSQGRVEIQQARTAFFLNQQQMSQTGELMSGSNGMLSVTKSSMHDVSTKEEFRRAAAKIDAGEQNHRINKKSRPINTKTLEFKIQDKSTAAKNKLDKNHYQTQELSSSVKKIKNDFQSEINAAKKEAQTARKEINDAQEQRYLYALETRGALKMSLSVGHRFV